MSEVVQEEWPLKKETFIVSLALCPKGNTKDDLPWPLPYYFITGTREEAVDKVKKDIEALFNAHEENTGRKFGE